MALPPDKENFFSTGKIFIVLGLVLCPLWAFLVWALGHLFGLTMRGYPALFFLCLLAFAGVGLVLAALYTLRGEPEHAKALQSHLILEIANETLPYLRKGLSFDSASKVARIIWERADAMAVAITDVSTVLAFEGAGEDHHKAGKPILTKATKEALEQNELRVLGSKEEIGCPVVGCPLQAAIVVPLEFKGEAAGALKFYYKDKHKLTESRLATAEGLAKLLSTQLELSEVERLETLACQAELKALQAQTNPHFLFNTLNTIAMLCRSDPKKARGLLIQFADFFRKSLERGGEMVTLEEELDYVDSYLVFEKARFGGKLQVIEEIEPSAAKERLPALILQPLVENAVKHGLFEGGRLKIKILARIVDSEMVLAVEDDGVGFSSEDLSKATESRCGKGMGLGLSNVNERLIGLYGESHRLAITSVPGKGTKVTMQIPLSEGRNEVKGTDRRR
ncbi:MAG: histidine kinase [Actinomycetota bacterium]|nr:histidine kinase [Actinomycetota bacterium]